MYFDLCNIDIYPLATELNWLLISLSTGSNICVQNVTEIVQIVFETL